MFDKEKFCSCVINERDPKGLFEQIFYRESSFHSNGVFNKQNCNPCNKPSSFHKNKRTIKTEGLLYLLLSMIKEKSFGNTKIGNPWAYD